MKHYFATLIKSVALKLVVPFLYFMYVCMHTYVLFVLLYNVAGKVLLVCIGDV